MSQAFVVLVLFVSRVLMKFLVLVMAIFVMLVLMIL